MTHDAIVSMQAAKATIDIRFLVYGRVEDDRSSSAQGLDDMPSGIVVIDSALYHDNLKRPDGRWRIAELMIIHDFASTPPRSKVVPESAGTL